MTAPQFAKSTDSDVIAAIRANEAARIEFGVAAKAFALKYASGPNAGGFYGGSNLGERYSVTAISSAVSPTVGRWTRQGNGWKPYKSNPVHKEMTALTQNMAPVPGSPGVIISDGPDFRSYFLAPRFFIHNGTAYMDYSMAPSGENYAAGDEWTAIRASEWHLAREQHDDEVTK